VFAGRQRFLSAIARDSVFVFIFYETEPLTAFELQLLDPRFYAQLDLCSDFDLDDIELVISHDDLSRSVRAFGFQTQ
jgi:hypothetical protein